MSFWNRLGAAAKEAALSTPLGTAFDIATMTKDEREAEGAAGLFAQAAKSTVGVFGLNDAMRAGTAGMGENGKGYGLMDAAAAPYSYLVGRPLSTLAQSQGDVFFRGQNPLSARLWRQNWNDSEDVSLGQAYASHVGLQVGTALDAFGIERGGPGFAAVTSRSFDPADAAQRKAAFEDDAAGKFASGTVDVLSNVLLDPLWVAGKGVKAARAAHTTVRPGKATSAALDFAAGNAPKAVVGKQAAKSGDRIKTNLLDGTDGIFDERELMLRPEFKDSSDAGALAHFFVRANGIEDKAVRDNVKLDIIGVALGNKRAAERLATTRADLAEQLKRTVAPIEGTEALTRLEWEDDGQAVISWFNTPEKLAEIEARRAGIEDEMARLDRLAATYGSTSKIGASKAEKAVYGHAVNGYRESILTDGMASRPIRVVKGAVGRAVPGHINNRDVSQGTAEMERILGRDPNMKADEKAALLREFMQAPTMAARGLAAQKAEAAVIRAAAKKHGLSPDEVKNLVKATVGKRAAYRHSLRSALYSASSDAKFASVIDDEGVAHAYDLAFLKSQIEDMTPISDPVELDNLLTRERRMGWLGKVSDAEQATREIAVAALDGATRTWKDLALMRAAYPLRIQVDTQTRLMSALGAMEYALAVSRGSKNFVKTAAKGRGVKREFRSEERVTDLLRAEDYKGVDITTARDTDELAMIDRTLHSNTTASLVMGQADQALLTGLRGTGNWGVVPGAAPEWADSFMRAVNKQVRNSPTARAALVETDRDALKAFVRQDPEAHKEWMTFRNLHDGNMDSWLDQVIANNDHLLSHPELRAIAAGRQVTADDLAKHMVDVRDRPTVHGEMYSPLAQNPVSALRDKVRKGFYRWVSDAPEEAMGRHPLYNARFRQHMREMVDRVEGDELTSDMVEQFRRNAALKARRDVRDTLFDLSTQSNMAHTVRFLSPFFAAWEDTMTKWGRRFYEDPSQMARWAQAARGAEASSTYTDDQGQDWLVLPKFLAPVLPAGAKNWKVRKDSFNIVFQGEPWWLPGFGPLVQVPTNEVVKKSFPEWQNDPVMKYVLPYGVSDDSPAVQVLPGWAKRAKAALSEGSADYAQTYAMLAAQEEVAFRQGKRKTRPTVQEISKKTRNWHLLRALSSFASPVTAEPSPRLQFYIEKAQQYRAQYGMEAQQRFYEDFPDYFEMSLSLSKNTTGITASEKAHNAAQKFRKEIAANPEMGWFYVGADNVGEFQQGVYAHQMTQALGYGQTETSRTRKNPQDALRDTQEQRGWMDYRKVSTAISLELEARGLTSLRQKGAEDLADLKRQFISELSQENPEWADAFGQRNPGKVQTFLRSALKAVESNKALAGRSDMKALQDYMEVRRAMRAELARREHSTLNAESNRDLAALWDQFTSEWKAENRGAEQMWDRVLEADTLEGDL